MVIDRVHQLRRNGVIGQLMRFGIVGVLVTLLAAAVYWPIATYGRMYGNRLLWLGSGAEWPLIGGTISFLVASAVGRVAHSRISFKGHGTRDERTTHRFFLVQMFGFGINQSFIWLLTGPAFHGQTWWPIIPTVFVTPLITFGLQRNWVYAHRDLEAADA